VVDVPNADQRLLPGMTASVEFIVEQVKDVLQVANAALRYRPDPAVMTAIIERKRAAMQGKGGPGGAGADSARAGGQAGGQAGGANPHAGGAPGGMAAGGMGGMGGLGGASGGMPANRGMLWFTDADGKLDVMFVRTGITDGTNTEIRGRELEAGKQVIAGVTTSATPAAAANSPFQQQQTRTGMPRPGGF
jgi:HlyD family secretion protein